MSVFPTILKFNLKQLNKRPERPWKLQEIGILLFKAVLSIKTWTHILNSLHFEGFRCSVPVSLLIDAFASLEMWNAVSWWYLKKTFMRHLIQSRMVFWALEVRKSAFLQLYVCWKCDFAVSALAEDFLGVGAFAVTPLHLFWYVKFKAVSYWVFVLCLTQWAHNLSSALWLLCWHALSKRCPCVFYFCCCSHVYKAGCLQI